MHEGPGFGLTTGFAQNQSELKKYWGYLRKFGFSQIAQLRTCGTQSYLLQDTSCEV